MTTGSKELGRWLLAGFVAMALMTPGVVAQSSTVVLQGADLYTVSGGVIGQGNLIIRDGEIQGLVGPSGALPADAEIVDVRGLRIYPGVIQSYSNLGLSEVDSVRGTDDIGEVGDNNADVRAEVAVSADNIRLLPAIGGGVLYAHVVPEGGSFTGTSAVMRLDGWNWEDMTVSAPAALHLYFPTVSDGEAASESKAMKALEQTLEDARDYAAARDAGVRLDGDRILERVQQMLEGDLRLVLHADELAQMEAAIAWTQEHGIKDWVLLGTTEAAYIADRLADLDIPLLLETVLWIPRRDFESYDANFAAAAKLAAAGVRFSFTGQGDSAFARNLPIIAGMTRAYGMDAEAALRSITLTAAELLGVDDRIGSLAVGKEASFVVTNGDLLEATTRVERVWIRGQEVDLERDPQRQLWHRYRERPLPTER